MTFSKQQQKIKNHKYSALKTVTVCFSQMLVSTRRHGVFSVEDGDSMLLRNVVIYP
jgi:hypothetical protein